MLWVDGRTAGPKLAKRSSSLRSHGLAGDGDAVQARWGGPLRVWLEESRGGRASGREQVPGMRSPGPAQPAETASVFGLRSRLGAFQSLRFRCAAKSGRPVPGPHLILSLLQVEGQALSATAEAAVPWPVLSPHPGLTSRCASPRGWGGRPGPHPPSALCPLGQLSARTSGLRTFPVPSLFWPQPRPPWAAPAHAPAHCACLWGHLFPPRPHALGGGDQVTLLPVGCQFPAHSQT